MQIPAPRPDMSDIFTLEARLHVCAEAETERVRVLSTLALRRRSATRALAAALPAFRILGWIRATRGADHYIARADAARDHRRWPEAANLYAEVLVREPALWPIWVQLGHARKESGDMPAAEAAYLVALRLAPDSSDTFLQLGHLLKITDRAVPAALAYLQSLDMDPENADALFELGMLLERDDPTITHALAQSLERLPHAAVALRSQVRNSLMRLALRHVQPTAPDAISPAICRYLIDESFKGILGREADPGALAHYLVALADGMNLSDMLNELLHAEEFVTRQTGSDPYDVLCEVAEEIEARLAHKLSHPSLAFFETRTKGSSLALAQSLRTSLVTLLDS
jgi:tetratricopeptide (TPR) repeat protein